MKAFFLAAFLAGCGARLPAALTDCPDATCRSDWVVAAFGRDTADGSAALAQIQDPIERATTLSRLLQTWPEKAQDLCVQFPRGPSHELCERVRTRPHLWNASPASPARARPGGGPASSALPTPDASSGRYAQVKALEGPCAHRIDPVACYTAQAVREASSDAPDRAAAACAAISDPRWRADCMFSAAETIIDTRTADGLGAASDLCIAAGDYAATCLSNLIERLAHAAPDATGAAADWAPALGAATALHQAWEAREPDLAPLVVDRYWSEALRLAYAWTPQVTGGPLDLLPPEAAPHVRASAASRLLALEGLSAHAHLADWVADLHAALSRRGAAPVPRPEADLAHDREIFWPADGPGDAEIPAIAYLGTGRRTWSPDLDADLAVVVLEAAARRGLSKEVRVNPAERAAAMALLGEGAEATDTRVRWTATRLRDATGP